MMQPVPLGLQLMIAVGFIFALIGCMALAGIVGGWIPA